jgi:hypothetical protein
MSLLATVFALFSCAVPRPAASQALRAEVGAYALEVLVDGMPARSFVHAGESHILGDQGSRYVVRVHNRSARRIEAVVSVDGLDVMDGKPADFANKRGYLVPAYGSVDIDGWRLSEREAAAFRFAPIGESYAAKTGKARNVGVIGLAVFPERIVRRPAPVYVPESSYRAPIGRDDEYGRSEGTYRSRPAAKGSAARESSSAPAAPPASRSAAPAHEAPESVSADATSSGGSERRARSGLGTEFGEALSSQIRQVAFVRAHASRPAALLGARYNDRAGLYALGIDVDGYGEPTDLDLRQSAQPFPQTQRRFARPPTDWRND